MIKRLFIGLCLLTSAVGLSQENNASPYSYYGIGDQKFKGTVESRAMGGLGIVADSLHLNLQNPATYNSLWQTTFAIGVSNTGTTFKTNERKETANRSALDYLAVGLPFKKVGVAFGLMPYTSVGYKIHNVAPGEDGFRRERQFNGSGGVNRVFFGAAYNAFKGFSIGADLQYNFGNIETQSIIGIPDLGVQYPTLERNQTNYGGFSFNFGATYSAKINSKLYVQTSATYAPESSINADTERQIATVTDFANPFIVDQTATLIINEKTKLPSKYTFGAGIGEARKWFAGAEYSAQGENRLSSRFDNLTTAGFESSYRLSVGGYYIPNYMAFNSYFSRITYRAGIRYENTGLVVAGETINDMGLNVGLGFPLGSNIGSSNLNLGLEYGKRGTTKAGLIQENYLNVFVSLSLNDRWFVKRRYD